MSLSNSEKAYLATARYFASKSKSNKRHGAIVVKSGSVVGTGFNKNRNHPLFVSPEHIKSHCSRHAEVEALKEAGGNADGAVLYVARVNNQGQDRNSRPCNLCEEVIKESKIKKVIYTKDETNVYNIA
jgi:pyrimidine deaminase RibD-like protein